MELRCKGCGKKPDEIDEYIVQAKVEKCTPDEFVWDEEGTLNRKTGQFYCTSCYIRAGEPLGTA